MNFNDYEKLSVATDVVVLTTDNKPLENNRKVAEKGLQILLVKRDENHYNGWWSLPGGFVNPEDTLIECVERKLKEKTGLADIYKEQLYTYGDDINRDSRGRVISVSYLALAPKEKIVIKSDRATKESMWFWVYSPAGTWDPDDLVFKADDYRYGTITDLAFDHNKIVSDAVNRIRNKIMYTDVAFHLVNEQFTVKELQTVYELLLGKEIQAFRRLMEDKIDELDEWTDGKAHRPARLFRKKGR